MSGYKPSKILDAGHLLESANDSARHFRNVYLAYLTVMIYIFIIVLSTDQELLFREGDKPLPLIHISVPIVAFFTWMPWALLVLHFYLLIQVKFLSEKVRFYKQEINDPSIPKEDVRKAQMLLAPVPLVHILVEEKAKSKQTMLYLIVFVSLVIFPLIVLIWAQIKFLPYQDEVITMSHRIVILTDVFLWYFGRYTLRFHEREPIWIKSIAGFLVVLVPVFVVVFINFPGSKIYNPLTASFYELEWVNEIMPTNHFDLPNRKLVEEEPPPELLAVHLEGQMDNKTLIEPGSPIWCQYAVPLDLEGRNFRKAKLERAALCKAILPNADITDASLSFANLTSADLFRANLTSADLREADLTDADLWVANLTSADLFRANLTDADLFRANLTSASLSFANLTSATLSFANLTSADLFRANLTSADLREADLTDADLREANLTDADLREADLKDASLREANLTSADLFRTNLISADLRVANLKDASLSFANLTSADLFRANLTDASLSFANLTSADLFRANLTSADLFRANLTSADLREANLTSADLREANLTSADLREADLTSADLTGVDLSEADLGQADLTAVNLSETNFSNSVLDGTTLYLTWVWESSGSDEKEYFPIGIPIGWNDTLKPKYLCPEDFYVSDHYDISEYITKDGKVERKQLKDRLKEVIAENCKPYKP